MCGKNRDERLKEIKLLLVVKRIEIFFLSETKIKSYRQKEVKEKLGIEWEILQIWNIQRRVEVILYGWGGTLKYGWELLNLFHTNIFIANL